MKKEYLPWILLYLSFAGFFFLASSETKIIAAGAKFAIVGVTWCRIVSFVVIGIVMEMSWYTPRTPIFNACRMAAETSILVALWQFDRPAEVVASVIAIATFELSRQRVKYS